MSTLDFEALAADLLRQLRGKRSQVGFSRRLKYSSNVSYLWESGRNWPTAATTLWAASRVGIDVCQAFIGFYGVEPSWLSNLDPHSPAAVATLLNDLRGDTSILELSERTERSRYAVSRWLKGQTEPRLPDFLRMLEACSQRVLDFVSHFAKVEAMPSAAEPWLQLQATRRLVSQAPWSPAVLLVLQTEDYKGLKAHEPGWIARRLGLPEAVEAECLKLLEASGQIQMSKRRYRVGRVQSVDTRSDPNAGRRLKQWWAQIGVDHIQDGKEGLYSFNVFSVSDADLERLEEMHRAYYRAMRALVAASEPPERVVVANVQLFALDRNEQGEAT